ncbi:polyprenyl synthetase family protein [Pseudaquidulcibacter saccharophilus]|uniref:polyprenyl synthetase family protein n=1 Tax=Pseudaquidulcibacter saccharophilus TaxID=2831900 RepID=UPI0030845E52
MNAPAIVPAVKTPNAMEILSQLLEGELAQTEVEISSQMMSNVGLIPDVAHHLVDAGGKRLRPLLTLAAAKMCGAVGKPAIKLAAAVEFIHSATLLHDDVVDGSNLRRGQKAANLIWGDKASVLVGDFLFARAFRMMVATNSLRILEILARTSSVIAEGEVLQLASTSAGTAKRETYFEVISSKTAALFAAATECGAICASADEDTIDAFRIYGQELGMAFQLADDALDYGGITQELGKRVGDDFREGKATFPLIAALEKADDKQNEFWKKVLARKHSDEDLYTALTYIKQTGAIEATLNEAQSRADLAKAALDNLADSDIKQALISLADMVVSRIR